MEEKRYDPRHFDSDMTLSETLAAILYLPVHIYALPMLLINTLGGSLSEAMLNFICYTIGTGYFLITEWRVLRRDYDRFCDHILTNAVDIFCCYFGMMALNTLVALVFQYITPEANPNNAAVVSLFDRDYGKTAAMTVYLAPIVEEIIFRAGIFGSMRGKSRIGAYLASVLLFALYHIWGFAAMDIRYIVYIVQYIPAGILLCRVYERSGSIWSAIFFHMIVNSVAMRALEAIETLM